MIADPYRVLGVDENCSDDELKKAYREQSKKWHPDVNLDRPEEAEQRFKEIQEAYRQITDARARGTSAYGPGSSYGRPGNGYSSSQGYGYQDFGGFSGFEDFFREWAGYSAERRQQEESNEMLAARNYINNGHYREALTALMQVDESARNARWYYYAAIASQNMGNNIDALNYAKRAVDMEPDNQAYIQLLQQLQNGGAWYQNRGETYRTFSTQTPATGWCLSMLALNLCCNMCGGGFFFC